MNKNISLAVVISTAVIGFATFLGISSGIPVKEVWIAILKAVGTTAGIFCVIFLLRILYLGLTVVLDRVNPKGKE